MTQLSNPSPSSSSQRSETLKARVESLRLKNTGPLPKSSNTRLPWVLTLLFGLLSTWFGWQLYSSPPASTDDASSIAAGNSTASDTATAVASTAEPTRAKTGDIVLESSGYIIPAHQIKITPRVAGLVTKLNIVEGQRVKENDIIAELEKDELQADYNRSLALLELSKRRLEELENGSRPEEIKQAEAELREATTQFQEQEKIWKRFKDLFQSRSISQQEWDQVDSEYWARSHRLEKLSASLQMWKKGPRPERIAQARAEVQQYEADVSRTAWKLSNCTIKAPISGIILKKNAEQGNTVNPIAFGGAESLCEMADLSDIEVELKIPETDIRNVSVAQKCRVVSKAFPDRAYDGVVDRLMPIAERSGQTVQVRVKVKVPADEEGVYLKPEMTAIVTFFRADTSPKPAQTTAQLP